MALLVAACGAAGPPSRHLVRPGASSGSSPSAAPGSVEAFVPQAEQFVQEHRGLQWKTKVPVTPLDDKAFNAKLMEKNNAGGGNAAVETAAKELEALGLIDGHPDLGALENSLLSSAVSGFYDPETKELYVRGVAPTPYVRQVIVHELTHALQDQWFGINRPQYDNSNDERAEAFTCVVEGDARRIEDEYVASESAQDQAEALQEQAQGAAGVPANIPQVLIELLTFPYVAGPRFDQAMISAGGQKQLDAAFTDPPTTTAEILHPERYLQHDPGVTVPAPAAGGKVFDTSMLGEQGLELLMEKAATAGTVDAVAASQAVDAWNGDRYVAWAQGSNTCMRLEFVAVSGQESTLLDGLKGYVASRQGATLEQSSPPVILTCG